jgi:hypothetical protein
MHFHYTVPIAIDGLGHITVISAREILQLTVGKVESLPIFPLRSEMEEEPFRGLRRVTDRALEILEMELSLGQPTMPFFIVALEADPHTLLLREFLEGGSGMRVMAFKAEPLADRGVFALVILSYDLFMALRTINHTQPLGMGKIFDIVMAIDTTQIMVDRRTKLFIVHIEGKLAFVNLLFLRGWDDHLEPFFPAHLEDIAGSMAFETCLILYGKSDIHPQEEGIKDQQ